MRIRQWIWLPLALAVAVLVFYTLDRLTSGRHLIPHPVPKPFVPPPPPELKRDPPPPAPDLKPVPPPAPVFPWEKKPERPGV